MSSGIDQSKSILITGATSGIGRALALALANLPTKPQVIAVGRREQRLDELKNQGLNPVKLDLTGTPADLKVALNQIVEDYPELDTLLLCAGIQQEFDFSKPETIKIENIIGELNINYISVVTVITYLLPHLQRMAAGGRQCKIIVMSSGLAMVPAAWVPNYCASKAALHSFTMALRATLHGTGISVIEVYPPLVESELHDVSGTTEELSKIWMTLDVFVKLVMPALLKGDNDVPIGMAATVYEKYETGKSEFATQIGLGHKSKKKE